MALLKFRKKSLNDLNGESNVVEFATRGNKIIGMSVEGNKVGLGEFLSETITSVDTKKVIFGSISDLYYNFSGKFDRFKISAWTLIEGLEVNSSSYPFSFSQSDRFVVDKFQFVGSAELDLSLARFNQGGDSKRRNNVELFIENGKYRIKIHFADPADKPETVFYYNGVESIGSSVKPEKIFLKLEIVG